MFFRFDSEGQALAGVSISDLKSGGIGGSNTNWKTLYEVKSENLGQGDKVSAFLTFFTKACKMCETIVFRSQFWYQLLDLNSEL